MKNPAICGLAAILGNLHNLWYEYCGIYCNKYWN